MENTNQHSILVFGADMSKLDDELRRNPQFRYLGASDIPRFREISPNAKRVIYNHSGLGNRPTRDLQMRIQEAREAGLTLIGIEVAHQGLLDSALRRELLSNGSPPAANANPVPNPALHSSNGVQGNHDSPTVAITGRNKVQIIFDGMKEGRDGDALFAMLKAEYPSAERKELGQLKWQVRHGRVRGRGMFSLSEPSIESKEPVRALGPEESIPKAGSVAEMLTKFRDGLASSLGILDEIIAKSRRQEETIEAIRPLGAMIKGVAEKLGDI